MEKTGKPVEKVDELFGLTTETIDHLLTGTIDAVRRRDQEQLDQITTWLCEYIGFKDPHEREIHLITNQALQNFFTVLFIQTINTQPDKIQDLKPVIQILCGLRDPNEAFSTLTPKE